MNSHSRFIAVSMVAIALTGSPVIGTSASDSASDSADKLTHSSTAMQDGEYVIDTGHKISGIAVIPARGHRGSAKLAVAHANAGARLYDVDGSVLWQDDTPASLVGFYQGRLIIYRKHKESTRLDSYSVSAKGDVNFVSSESPSPISATTIQRTAYSSAGPVRLSGNSVSVNNKAIKMKETVSAFASAKLFIPLTAVNTYIFALDSGKLVIRAAE